MNEKQWSVGEDDEELFEYAMHPAQYEAYRSGKAQVEFLADVASRKAALHEAQAPAAVPVHPALPSSPQTMTVDVNGQAYKVTVSYGDTTNTPVQSGAPSAAPATAPATGSGMELLSPLEGKFFLVKSASDIPVKVGDVVKEGQLLCYIEAMKTYNAVRSEVSGTITSIAYGNGDSVVEDDVLMTIQ